MSFALSKNIVFRPFLYFILIGILLYYYSFDPIQKGSLPIYCPFKWFTGLSCIGCGSQRALHALLHGKVILAMGHNLLFVVFLPFIIALYLQIVETHILRSNLKIPTMFNNVSGKWTLIVIIAFTIIRNLPWFRNYLSI